MYLFKKYYLTVIDIDGRMKSEITDRRGEKIMNKKPKSSKPRKKPDEYAKQVQISEEGQERLLKIIRDKFPDYDEMACLEVLWGNTDAPYGEYRVVRKQLEEYLRNK